jgi:MFS family permease
LNTPQDVITCKRKAASNSLKSTISNFIHSGQPKSGDGFFPDCIPMDDAAFSTVSAIFTVGGFIGALATNPIWLGVGRLLSGIGAGAATVVVPLYISEVSPPKERGLFGTMTQVSINVGILFTQTLGHFLSHGAAWRYILGAGIVKRIRGQGKDITEETAAWDSDVVNSEQEGLLARPDAEDGQGNKTSAPVHMGFVEVIRDPWYRPAIVAVVGIMFAQQLCGVNSVMMYSTSLLKDSISIQSSLLTILVSGVNLVMTLCCSVLPDKLGRRTCLVISAAGQGLASCALAFAMVGKSKTIAGFCVAVFVGFFAVGLGPVPFILASELVGQEAVGATQSWALGANYFATFIVAQFFPIVNNALNRAFDGSGYVFFIFAVFGILSAIFILARVPETKGKKDADEVWGRQRRLD